MYVGIIDADLLDNGTHFPNLACMKISGYHKGLGDIVELILSYDDLDKYDKIYISKVFTKTEVPEEVLNLDNVVIGGTGFYYDKAPSLPYDMEHHMPDYLLYSEYVETQKKVGTNHRYLKYYTDYSIGFTTRGCIRKCSFCVNRNSKASIIHSPINEFLNSEHKYISLWDDNFLACKDWKSILEELKSTGKRFRFQQGLDFRLLTPEKMKLFKGVKYDGDFIFAFDNIKDKEIIEKNLALWERIVGKRCVFYILCGYENLDTGKDIEDMLERVSIVMEYGHLPYIMRHENHSSSKFKRLYTNIARWCNQPNMFKKKSFREFAEFQQSLIKTKGKVCSCMRALSEFESEYKQIADKYFDLKFRQKR